MTIQQPSTDGRVTEALRLLFAAQEIDDAAFDKQFEQSKAYITLVVGLGYVGFFAIWNFARDVMPEKANSLSAILMGVSLLAFILFEVRKMFLIQAQLLQKAKQSLVQPNITDVEGLIRFGREKERQNQENIKEARRLLKKLIPEWKLAFGITLLFGVSAAGLLLYNLFAHLTEILPMWPGERVK